VLLLEHDVDNALGGRLDLWFDAYGQGGSVYLPLVMVDSGDEISNGEENFETVYGGMIDAALQRPAAAGMTVTSDRSDAVLRFDVRLTNLSGTTLSVRNGATLTALIWREPADPASLPFISVAATHPITSLDDGATADISFEVAVGALDPNRTRWVVIAHYRPGTGATHDTLQAVAGP
jgi:hypothetical protein